MNILSWVGNTLIILGLWGMGNKRRGAFLFSIVGEGCWIAYSVFVHLWSLTFVCVIFLCLAARNYIKWGRS
jgi:hypothetical protein